MTAIHVDVPAELIDPSGADVHKFWDVPIQAALAELTGLPVAEVDIDTDGEGGYVATIGSGAWTLVLDLPRAACDFLDFRWENGGPGDPFAFDIEVPDWIVRLLERAR